MKTPPDKQVVTLLAYLKQAFRQDEEIIGVTEAKPEEIVASVRDYQPVRREDGETVVYGTELPAICISTRRSKRRFTGKRWRRERSCDLWYLFETPGSDGLDVHGLAKTERIKSIIEWRMRYWFYVQKLPPEGPLAGEVFDLQTEADIHEIELGEADWFNEGAIQGLRWDLTITHDWAPYDEVSPAVLDIVDFTVTEDAGSGASVRGLVDVSS